MQQRRDGTQRRKTRAEKEADSFRRQWTAVDAAGGNSYTPWPLKGMQSILEKTTCCSWDGEAGTQAGRRGCQSYMEFIGVDHAIHDHIKLQLKCRDRMY